MVKCHNCTIAIFLIVTAMAFLTPHAAHCESEVPAIDSSITDSLDASLTIAKQKTGYLMGMEYKRTVDGVSEAHAFNLVYDPFASYGIDLRVQVLKKDVHKYDRGDIKKKLDEIMALQMKLLSGQFWDAGSLRTESPEGDSTVFSFTFDSEALPPELRLFEHLRGYAYVAGNTLEKIVLTNEAPFEHSGIEIEAFKKLISFTSVEGRAGALIHEMQLEIEGRKDNHPYQVIMSGKMLEYWDKTQQHISMRGGMQKRTDLPLDDRYETIYVELDRTFPLLGKSARKEGYDLPKPYGISLVTMLQQTTMHMTSFELDGVDVGRIIGGDEAKVDNSAMAILLRADMWLLPFMNIGLIAGKTSTSSDITLQWLPEGALGGLIQPGDTITVEDNRSDTTVYGVGTTLAGGVGNFFATVDLQYITSYTEAADAELTMAIATPMVGYSFIDYGFRTMLGGQYQDTKEDITATLTRSDGTESKAVVGLQSEKWAGLIGIDKSLSRHWSCSMMYSYGEDRQNLNIVLGYRF